MTIVSLVLISLIREERLPLTVDLLIRTKERLPLRPELC